MRRRVAAPGGCANERASGSASKRDRAERAQRRDPALHRDRDDDERREQQLAGRPAGADHAGGEAALGRRARAG